MGDHLIFSIALTQTPFVGSVTAKQLISYCGSPESVFRTPMRQLLKIPGVGDQTAKAILGFRDFERAQKELDFIQRQGLKAVLYTDPFYPDRLRHYPDAPVILYAKGDANLNPEKALAVVGTRQPSPQGAALCQEIVRGLAPFRVQIISGLAYGIDAVAHRTALEVSLPTVAVLGHGLSRVYPAQNQGLAADIANQNGALVTEFLSDTGPDRENFPMRNRIVAGMCDALLVVETGAKGGSLITANLANDYHKDVFAIPGRVKDPKSEGCNALIKNHKAGLVETAEDIAYFMQWNPPGPEKRGAQTSLFAELSPNEQKVLNSLREQRDPCSIDKLAYQTQLQGSEIAAVLLNLEFKCLVKCMPGKRFIPV